MDAIALLKKQHTEVKMLFKKFKQNHGPDSQRTTFEAIADSLAAHCEIEEKLFYPAVFISELQPLVQEAVEEHLSAKRVIADLLAMEPTHSQYVAKVTVLEELIAHHINEEHEHMFPLVRERLTSKELKALGESMSVMFDAAMDGKPRRSVPNQTKSAAALPAPA